jgi:inorganic pyrophosphatase
MKVFVENEAGLNIKNLYDEKTLSYKKTVEVSRPYPYPYGFIIDTTSGDGDNLDCFIITEQKLTTGTIYDCEPIGLMEQHETSAGGVSEEDHNVLAVLEGEQFEVTQKTKETLTEFVSHVFDHLPHKKVTVGEFKDKEFAQQTIDSCQDN